jgi:beta-glucosidase
MKNFFKIVLYILGIILLAIAITYLVFFIKWKRASSSNMALLGAEAPVLTVSGHQFRDLNKNGRLDLYEDSRQSIETRVEDLISQMNMEEKAGMLFIHMVIMEKDGSISEIPSLFNPFSLLLETTSTQVARKLMNHFNILQATSAEAMVKWNNEIQKMAERTRLGIPVTIATDPRHGKEMNIGTAISTRFFSRWPSPLGLAATRDSALVHEFADMARQEYLAVGLRLALHPMADLATEPRWARINGTFGEDASLSAKLTAAYVLGFQGDSLSPHSVACMTKHFSGGGPQEDGWDAHFASGPGQVYPGKNFDYHLIPFTEGAFPANTAAIMPYYGIPKGQTSEDVGFAFNKDIITVLLRDSLGFEGVVCTDWGIVTDMAIKEAAAWGVEHLSEKERVKKIFDAGCDMIGGDSRTDLIIELVEEGSLSEERIDKSLRRILKDKFILGIFDNPYLDNSKLSVFENPTFKEKGKEAQRKSMVLLKNEDNTLPLSKGKNVFVMGMNESAVSKFTTVVETPEEAEVILLKLETPSSPPPGGAGFLEKLFPQGRLDFPEEELTELLDMVNSKPTVTVLTISRPPVVPEIDAASKAVVAEFEIEDDIICEMIFGKFNPTGKLPLEIPSSMEAVEKQYEDVPYDSENPLYPFGHGLSY